MGTIGHSVRQTTEWLHHALFEYGYFYYDLWSIAHFWTGMVLFAIITFLKFKNRWRVLFYSVVGFEIVEAIFFIFILGLFKPEKTLDVFHDIFLGMAGGFLVYIVFEKLRLSHKAAQIAIMLFSAGTFSFLWTGFYKHDLSGSVLHTVNGIAWGAMLVWTLAAVLILLLHKNCRKLSSSFWVSLPLSVVFNTGLLFVLYAVAPFFCGSEDTIVTPQHQVMGVLSESLRFPGSFLWVPVFCILIFESLTHVFGKYQKTLKVNDI